MSKNIHNRLLTGIKIVQEAEFTKLQKHVERNNFFIVRTSFGFVLVPSVHGKSLKSENIEGFFLTCKTLGFTGE